MAINEVTRGGKPYFELPEAADVRSRGGSMGVDLDLRIKSVPFLVRGDEVDFLELTPIFPEGVGIQQITGRPSSPAWRLSNGTEINLDTDPIAGFDADAVLQMPYKIPVANLVERGDGMTETKRLRETGSGVTGYQQNRTQELIDSGAVMPDDIVSTPAFYSTRRNNAIYSDGTKTLAETGKVAQGRRPEGEWQTQGGLFISSETGWWERQEIDGKVEWVKVFDLRTRPAEAAFFVTAATLGYTTIGGSNTSNLDRFFNKVTSPEAGTTESFTYYQVLGSATQYGGFYNRSSEDSLAGESLLGEADPFADLDNQWQTQPMVASLPSGDLWLTHQARSTHITKQDVGSVGVGRTSGSLVPVEGLEDPAPSISYATTNFLYSMYLTYTAGPPPVESTAQSNTTISVSVGIGGCNG